MTDTLVTLTPAAIGRMRELLASKGSDAFGVRLAIKPTGCSGYSYLMDFASAAQPGDHVVDEGGVRLVIDQKAHELVAGTRIDFVEDKLGAQFVFSNPNEKSRCGCGESFTV